MGGALGGGRACWRGAQEVRRRLEAQPRAAAEAAAQAAAVELAARQAQELAAQAQALARQAARRGERVAGLEPAAYGSLKDVRPVEGGHKGTA